MKSKSLFAVAMALLIPTMAFAKPKDSANVQIYQTVTVAGTQLAPGEYKLLWKGSGANVTVNFTEGKKTLATAPAMLVSTPSNQDAIETDTTANNTTVLRAIDLNHITLQFENAGGGAGN